MLSVFLNLRKTMFKSASIASCAFSFMSNTDPEVLVVILNRYSKNAAVFYLNYMMVFKDF